MNENGVIFVRKSFSLSLSLHTWLEGKEYLYKVEDGVLFLESEATGKGHYVSLDESKDDLSGYVDFIVF